MKRVLVQSTDNQRGQDGLMLQLYVHAPTQTAFVLITGSFSVVKPKQAAAIVTVLIKNGALSVFFFPPRLICAFLICHFVNSRGRNWKNKGEDWNGWKSGLAFWSWPKKKKKKKWGNYFQNKQLPFASQLKNNKSQKWPVAEHLNTHINHKNSYTAPWQCIATVQNFSQGERRQKNTLLLLTPASHFGLQRF